MALDEPKERDHTFSFSDFDLIIDPMSFNYVDGAEITYAASRWGSGFQVVPPSGVPTSSC